MNCTRGFLSEFIFKISFFEKFLVLTFSPLFLLDIVTFHLKTSLASIFLASSFYICTQQIQTFTKLTSNNLTVVCKDENVKFAQIDS